MSKAKIWMLLFTFLVFLPQQAEARAKKKKRPSEKDHPNYQHYIEDDEFLAARSKRLAGILITSIGGGVGGGVLIGGILWNTCMGAHGDTLDTCRRNARVTMALGAIATGASLSVGIPMISVGREGMDDAKQRIDGKYPVKEQEESGGEASRSHGPDNRMASSGSMFQDYSLAVRVLNLQF